MPEKRKAMLSAEELEFLGKKDNGFQKPVASTPAPKREAPSEDETILSIDDDLESLSLESLKTVRREATVRFTVDLSERMHQELRKLSAAKNVKMTKLVRMAIANMLAALKED